jgi:two-component system, sensor histidine kinase LadS
LLPSGSAQWTRIEISMPTNGALGQRDAGLGWQRWHLGVGSPSVDRVSLHWRDDTGAWQGLHAGDLLPVASWPIPDHNPVFPLPKSLMVEGDGASELWLRTQHARVPVAFSIELLTESALRERREVSFLLFGGFFAIAAMALALCAFHVIRDRDWVFMAYGLLVLAMIGMQAQLTGVAGLAMFNHWPMVNDRLSFMFAEAYAHAGLLFAALATRRFWGKERLARLIRLWLVFCVAVMLLHVWLFDRTLFVVANIAMPVSMLAALGLTWHGHRRGDRYAMGIGLGLLPVVVCACFPLLRNQGLLATGFLSQYGLLIGALAELAIVTWVLSERNAQMREATVRERALVSTDALTGLPHETLFLARLHSTAVRARRLNRQFGLVALCIDDLTELTGQNGFAAQDKAMVVVAGHLQQIARPIDMPVRLSANEFMLLIEGPVSVSALTDVGTRLMARLLRPVREDGHAVNLRGHITCMLLPSQAGASLAQESELGLSPSRLVRWLLAQSDSFDPQRDKPVRIVDGPEAMSIV